MVPIPFIVLALNIMTVASAGNTARGSGLAVVISAKSSLLKNKINTVNPTPESENSGAS